jgi:hypothetical protein
MNVFEGKYELLVSKFSQEDTIKSSLVVSELRELFKLYNSLPPTGRNQMELEESSLESEDPSFIIPSALISTKANDKCISLLADARSLVESSEIFAGHVDVPLSSNSFKSLEFNRFIARQLSAHYDCRTGNACFKPVTVCRTRPSSKYFEDRVATKWSDILSCGVIVDRKAKEYEKAYCGDNSKWNPNPQGYHTMMVPAHEEHWVKENYVDLNDCANEASQTGICGYVGMQPRLAKKGKSNKEAYSSSEEHHDDSTTPAIKYRLWRFQLLNYRQLRTIVNFRRERALVRGKKKKPRLQLRRKDFKVDTIYFFIALPTSEFNLPFSSSSTPLASGTGTAFQNLDTASRTRCMSTASSVSENSSSWAALPEGLLEPEAPQPLHDGPQTALCEGFQDGFFGSTALCRFEQWDHQSPCSVQSAVGDDCQMDISPSAAVCANEPFCAVTGGDEGAVLLVGQYGASEGACDSSEWCSSISDPDSLGEGSADMPDGEVLGELEYFPTDPDVEFAGWQQDHLSQDRAS